MKRKNIQSPGWETIATLGWGTWTTDYTKIHKLMKKTLTDSTIHNLNLFVSARVNEIYKRVEEWEDRNRTLNVGSDDTFSDIRYHVVGLGKEEFDRVMADPTLLEKRHDAPYNSPDGYVESFCYCFL